MLWTIERTIRCMYVFDNFVIKISSKSFIFFQDFSYKVTRFLINVKNKESFCLGTELSFWGNKVENQA